MTDAVSAAAMRTIASLAPRSVVCITGSGATTRAICRYRPDSTVFAVTTNEHTYRQLNLVWGATPILGATPGEESARVHAVLRDLKAEGCVRPGQIVPVVAGSSQTSVASNILRVETVDSSD